MSPIELLKHGINNKSWLHIVEAYRLLTGEEISFNDNSQTNIAETMQNQLSELLNSWSSQIAKKDISSSALYCNHANEGPLTNPCNCGTDCHCYVYGNCGVKGSSYSQEKLLTESSPIKKSRKKKTDNTIASSTPQKGKYGFGHTVIMTDDNPSEGYNSNEEEMEANKRRAEAQKLKQKTTKRKPHRLYEVECSSCEKPFKSLVPDKEIGQYCTKCLRKMPREQSEE